jgi:hypothetical protein
MEETSRTYIEKVDGFADIAIEVTRTGQVIVRGWPEYTVSSETICKVLRTLADNIEQITDDTQNV